MKPKSMAYALWLRVAMIHLVTHNKSGTGYALQETDGRWVVRFHHNYHKYYVFTKNAFKHGYLKDCGVVNLGDNNE